MLTELDAAQKRDQRQEETLITAAWVTAALTRARKLPKLKDILRRDREPPDLRHYLDGLKSQLPGMTMAEWRESQKKSEG